MTTLMRKSCNILQYKILSVDIQLVQVLLLLLLIDSGSSFGTLNTEDYLTDRLGIGTRYYSRSEQPRPTVKPLDEIKLDLLDDIRTVKNKTELYMLLSKSMRELQF